MAITAFGFAQVQKVDNLEANKRLTVPVYADAAARDAAIPSPDPGMAIFNSNTKVFNFYDGSAWVASPNPPGSAGTAINDTDGNTKIQTEKIANEDVIRFDVAGTEVATFNNDGTFTHNGLTHSTGTKIGQVKTMNVTTNLPANTWTTIGRPALSTGMYAFNYLLNDPSVLLWNEHVSGVMTWYNENTNDTSATLIPVINAGHASNGYGIEFRFLRRTSGSGGNGVLQMRLSGISGTFTTDFTITFLRLL